MGVTMSITREPVTVPGATSRAGTHGLVLFSAIMLSIAGVWQLIMSVAALAEDTVFVTVGDYLFKFDLTTWGWIHLAVGAILLAIGIALMVGQTWARWAGVVAAGLSLLVNFAWLPWFPLWALVVIALDCLVIWALLTQPDAAEAR